MSKIKHGFFISRDIIKLEGIFAWLFIIEGLIWFFVVVFDIIKLFI